VRHPGPDSEFREQPTILGQIAAEARFGEVEGKPGVLLARLGGEGPVRPDDTPGGHLESSAELGVRRAVGGGERDDPRASVDDLRAGVDDPFGRHGLDMGRHLGF
jgi:hypothetical protein